MCGRFVQERSTAELADLFEADSLVDDPGSHYNLAPTDPAAVVVQREDRRAITVYRWGLIPPWAKSPAVAARQINARAETLAASPAFRDAFRRRRCLVPADAFYEWRRDGARRQPFVIRSLDGAPMAFAGLWAGWRDPATGDVRRTFTIVTTTPNELIAPLHDRMPVIVPREAWSRWLDPDSRDHGELQGLLVPPPSEGLELYPVEPLVNDVRNNGPMLIAPIVLPDEPAQLTFSGD